MHYTGQDILVGGIAILLGLAFLYCSLSNHAGFFRLRKIQWLDSRFGRAGARWICVAIAAALILFGGAIASGFSLQRFLASERALLGPRVQGQRLAKEPWWF